MFNAPCPDCITAQRHPRRNLFQSHCRQCQARALAAIGAHLESQAQGTMTEQYRAALQKMFGDDYMMWHEAVKAWAAKIKNVC